MRILILRQHIAQKIDLTVEGDAKLTGTVLRCRQLIPIPFVGASLPSYNGGAEVTIPIPAAPIWPLHIRSTSRQPLELVYERTYWSAYKNWTSITTHHSILFLGSLAHFDTPLTKDWKDTNTYRIG